MKTIAITTSAAIPFMAPGIGRRWRFCRGGFGSRGFFGTAFLASGSGAGRGSAAGVSVAGTSALIGRSRLTAANAT
jgi:hypothetical protein